jgi:hypothetical protein
MKYFIYFDRLQGNMKPLLQLYPQHAIYRLHDGHEHQVHSAVEILNLELNTNVNYYKHSYDVQR